MSRMLTRLLTLPALLVMTTGALGASPTVIKMTPGMTTQSLANRADSDLVDLSSGRRLPVRDLRRLDAVGQKLRAAGAGKTMSPALTARPAAKGIPLRQRNDLLAALKRPDSDTIQLPSGERLTVGQLRLLKPEIEKRLGRPIDAVPDRQVPTGPATRLQRGMDKEQWKGILQNPDNNTVLESPNGKRITIGELKQVLTMGRGQLPAKGTGGRR